MQNHGSNHYIRTVNIDKIVDTYKKGYRIDNAGIAINPKGLAVKGVIDSNGYKAIKTRVKGKVVEVQHHRLQSYQKYGDAMFKDGIVVRHLNGIKTDNSWDNIGIGTGKENAMDIPKHIRIARSLYAASFNKKHNAETIKKWHYENGSSYKKTMDLFNISSKGTLHYILNN